jgi:hypothetical protein
LQNFALDIRENYYKLVHNLLINNWRYFFKGNVLTTFNGEVETTANEQSFIQLMEVRKNISPLYRIIYFLRLFRALHGHFRKLI